MGRAPPVIELRERLTYLRWGQEIRKEFRGRGSDRLLEERSRLSRRQEEEEAERLSVEKELPRKFKNRRAGKEASWGRLRDPMRPAFSRLRDSTLPLESEQETPVHEHGLREPVSTFQLDKKPLGSE